MILYDKDGNRYIASKIKMPRNLGGINTRWDIEIRKLDGLRVRMWTHRAIGTSFYFERGWQWYRLPHYKYPKRTSPTDAFDVREFFTKPPAQGPMAAKAGQ